VFELPEYANLARQMNATIRGKTVAAAVRGNAAHRFVWYNREPAEFARIAGGKVVGEARVRGRWLFAPLEPGYVLVFGECGGSVLFHPAGAARPKKHHLLLEFADGSGLSATTRMWGAYELYETGREQERKYIRGMRVTPVEPAFTSKYFSELVDELVASEKQSVKSLLTQDQLIPGLGNGIAQDIMFRARLHPKRGLADLDGHQRRRLYSAIVATVKAVTAKGGRNDETDLFGKPGGYRRLMDNCTTGKPCPECGTKVVKQSFLGGSIYFCPTCQE
jgi:formamidopyrimidine-DNA glycosylase